MNILCKWLHFIWDQKIEYSFFPSPRIKFNDFIIKDFSDKKKTLGTAKDGVVKISFYNLLNKKKFYFTKIQLRNTVINFDLNELKKYKDFSKKKFNSIPIDLQKGELNFLDGKKSIATIRNVNLKYKSKKNGDDIILKGIFFDNNIYINLKNKENEDSKSKIFTLKFLDLRTKINIFNSDPNKKTMDGNISIKKNKNRLTAIFDYKDGQIIIKHANLRNAFLDGKSNGIVKFLPYFNFDLNVDLNAVNFNRLHSTLVALDENSKKKLFKVNRTNIKTKRWKPNLSRDSESWVCS